MTHLSYDWNKDLDKIIKAIFSTSEPFIIEHFFNPFVDDLPVSENDFAQQLGSIPLSVQEFNLDQFIKQTKNKKYKPLVKKQITFKDYQLHSIQYKSGEGLAPEKWIDGLNLCVNKEVLESFKSDESLMSYYFRFFVGMKGHETDPHFDWTAYHNFLFQVYGKKEVITISPEYFNTIPFIANFSEFDTDQLIKHCKTENIPFKRFQLLPHQGLYIPPYYLHSVKYLEGSASLSLRMFPQKNKDAVHKRLPPSSLIAFNLWKNKELHQLQTGSYKQIIQKIKADFNIGQDEKSDYSEDYENFLFNKINSFEGVLDELKRRNELISRGACYFPSFKKS